MKKWIKMLLVSLGAAIFLTACSEPPTAKVDEAKNLIAAVIAAGGEQLAPQKVESIKKRYAEALAEIDLQNKVTFRNYSMAVFTLDQLMDECDELKNKIAQSRGEPTVQVAKRLKPFSAQ